MHFHNIVGQGCGNDASAEPAAITSVGDLPTGHGGASSAAEAGAAEVAVGVTSELANEHTDLIDEVLEEWETAIQAEWEKFKSVVEVAVMSKPL